MERILQSKKEAKLQWEKKWKLENPSTMPRTFDEADIGALGARFGGLSVGDQGDGVPDAVMTAQGEKI
eukprot:1398462-Prorocentrum_lima.AAC.1